MLKDAKARFGGGEGAGGVHLAVFDHHHLAGFDLADELGPNDVETAGFRRQRPSVIADAAQHKRAHAQRIAHTDQFGAGHGDDGKCAFDAAQRVFDPFGDVLLDRARHQVDDTFAVRRGLKDAAALNQLAAQGRGVGQVAIVGDGGTAHRKLAKEGLHVADRGRAF